MNLRTSLTTAAILLAVANPTYAKLGVKVGVQVSDEKIRNTLQESMKARLNSTGRYIITDTEAATDLLMEVNCLVLENEGGVKNGIVCDSVVTYYPYRGSQVSTRLDNAGHMAVSGIRESSFVIEKLLNLSWMEQRTPSWPHGKVSFGVRFSCCARISPMSANSRRPNKNSPPGAPHIGQPA